MLRPFTSVMASLSLLALGAVSASAQTRPSVIPANTPLTVRTSERIDSRNSNLSREYLAVLDEPLVVDGAPVADKGTEAILMVSQAQQAGAVSGRASLTLQLAALKINGVRIPIVSGDVTSESGSQAGKAAKGGVGGAAIGAILGGVLGGAAGAAKGAAIGGSVGVGAAAVTGQRVQVPAESRLTFVLAKEASLAPAAETSDTPITRVEAPPVPRPTTLPSAVIDQIRFQFVEAVADGKQLRIKLTALNQGVDRLVDFYIRNGPQIVDERGNKYGYPSALVTIGNQKWRGELINGVRTDVLVTIDDIATVGGAMQSSEIKRLTIPVNVAQPGQGVIEMRDILITK